MNLLWLINHSHYGNPDACNHMYSALSIHVLVLNRRKIPKKAAPFEHLEDIAIHSFYARIVALFHIRMKELFPSYDYYDIHDPEMVNTFMWSSSRGEVRAAELCSSRILSSRQEFYPRAEPGATIIKSTWSDFPWNPKTSSTASLI